MEHTDVAMSMAGSAVKSSEVRNSASRVALPLTNWAVTAAAAEHGRHHRAGHAFHSAKTSCFIRLQGSAAFSRVTRQMLPNPAAVRAERAAARQGWAGAGAKWSTVEFAEAGNWVLGL